MGFIAGWVLYVLDLGCLSPGCGLGFGVWWLCPGCGWVSVFLFLLSLVVVGCFGLLPFPLFLGEVLSMFLFFWALGSCILWLCGFAFWK